MRGLINRGSNCCVNSVVQCLAVLLEDTPVPSLLRVRKDTHICRARNVKLNLTRLLADMSDDRGVEGPCDPWSLVQSMAGYSGTGFDVQQEDANAAFACILETLQACSGSDSDRVGDLWGLTVEDRVVCLDCKRTRSSRFKTNTFSVFDTAPGVTTLQEYIDGYSEQCSKSEVVCYCHHCGTATTREHSSEVVSLPSHLLCVRLPRALRSETQNTFTFSERLDMSRVLPRSIHDAGHSGPGDVAWYDLRGVIMHRGTCNHGHYFAYVKKGVVWYCTDDTYVEPCSWERVRDSHGGRGEHGQSPFREVIDGDVVSYMLMYTRL